jgi:hypothetical protein
MDDVYNTVAIVIILGTTVALMVSCLLLKRVAVKAIEVANGGLETVEKYRVATDQLYSQLRLGNDLIQSSSLYMTAMEMLLTQYIQSSPPTTEMLEEYDFARAGLIQAMTALAEEKA